MTKRKKAQETQKSTGCEVKKGMPASVTVTEKDETSRKGPRSEDESTETGPKQAEHHGESASNPIPSTSKDNLQPPIFKVNYPFLRSSVKRPKKDANPPPQPPPTSKKGKDDDHKPAKAVKTERKRWEAWGNQDKTLFFEALNEFGKDFEAIQKYIEQRHKKRGDPGGQVKNKDQVRHLYYRTCHKLFKYITADADQTKTANELYALINYGELRKKIKGVIDARTGLKLNELVKKGSTTIRYQQRNTRLRTPTCKALKLLRAVDEEDDVKPTRLPPRVMLELTPKNNAAWATVQGVAHNPRVRMVVPLRKELGSLLNMLSQKWTPHRIKLLQSMKPAASESVPQVKLETVEGATVTPYDQLTGCYVHDKGKVPFYPGQDSPPNKSAGKRTAKGKGIGKGMAERVLSPVETKGPVEKVLSPVETKRQVAERLPSSPVETKSHVAERLPSSPVDHDQLGVTKQAEGHDGITSFSLPHNGMDVGILHRTDESMFQCHDRLFGGDPSTSAMGEGTDGMDFSSLPMEFTPIPPTEITEDFSIPVNQTDYTRIEVSNHRRKTSAADGGGEPAEMGNGNNVVENVAESASREQCFNSPDKGKGINDADETNIVVQEQSKELRLKTGVTMENVGDISITDVYLMLGMPKVLKFAYDFVHTAASGEPNIKLLDRLTQLANSEFSDITKPKQMVSIGVATSPTRSGIPPKNAETPPSKSSSAPNHGKSPVSSRGGSSRKSLPSTPKSSSAYTNKANAPIIVSPATAAAAVAKACEARGIADRPQPRRDKAVFLAPKPVAPRRITPTPVGGPSPSGEADKLFKAQLESLQKSDWQLPKRQARKPRGRRPLVVQRTLLPRPQSDDVRHMMSMSIVSNSSHASTGQFMPVKLGVDALGSSPQSPANRNAVVIATKPNNTVRCHSPLGIPITPNKIVVTSLVASTPKTQGNTGANNSYLNSPVSSPLGPIFISSPVASPVGMEALSPAGLSPGALSPAGTLSPVTVEMANMGSPLTQTTNLTLTSTTSTLAQSVLATDPLLSTPPTAVRSINSSSLRTPSPMLNKTDDGVATLTISPPNISSLLDISLPSAESAGTVGNDTLLDLGFGQPPTSDSSPSRMVGSTTPPLTMTSPSTSPFKLSSLGTDNQWLNGEVSDISLSSILATFESPEKKDQNNTTVSITVPLCPPVSPPRVSPPPRPTCPSPVQSSFYDNSSRDSSITGISKDVDTHLQCMMNESSVDYVAKFADLAAHIAASAEPPKN